MDILELRAFVAVAEELHFGRAAARLQLAQPYISRKIRDLENELRASLFLRTTRSVELTPAGYALLAPARTALAAVEDARATVEAARRQAAGRVRISFAGPSAHQFVARLARAARQRHPLVDLQLQPGRYGTTALEGVLRRDTDLAFARFAGRPAGVSSRLVATERCVVALPGEHRLAQRPDISFADVRDEPLVTLPESLGSIVRTMVVSRCHEAGFAPRIVQTAPDSWTCLALVSAGVGLHFTLDSAVTNLPLDGVRIVDVTDPTPPVEAYLVWRDHDDAPALGAVLDVVGELFPPIRRLTDNEEFSDGRRPR